MQGSDLTLPKLGVSGKQRVANLSFTYTYADRLRWQKQLALEEEQEDSYHKEMDISKNGNNHTSEARKMTKF